MKSNKVNLGDVKEMQKQGSWIPMTPEKPIFVGSASTSLPFLKRNVKKRVNNGVFLNDHPYKRKQQRKALIVDSTCTSIPSQLDGKSNTKKISNDMFLNERPGAEFIKKKHSKPKVLSTVPVIQKHASIKESPFGNNLSSCLACSSNKVIGVSNSPYTNEHAQRLSDFYSDNHNSEEKQMAGAEYGSLIRGNQLTFKEINLCATNQLHYGYRYPKVYQRRFRVSKSCCENGPAENGGQEIENEEKWWKKERENGAEHGSLIRGNQLTFAEINLCATNQPHYGNRYLKVYQRRSRVNKPCCEHGPVENGGQEIENEEKWWKKEREVFRTRIERFLGCVCCIQGKRRFSSWNGSVLDSIIGVFLTQNVSDHLSSSAFMSLAAQYPNTESQQDISMDCCNRIEKIVCELNMEDQVPSSGNGTKRKKNASVRGKIGKFKNPTVDWSSLRGEYFIGKGHERSTNTMDSVNWHAVRNAKPEDVSATILRRGMNNNLTERIQDFLNRLVKELKSIDLEWLRNVPPQKAKEFLMGIRGLGLKSSECVRLLTLKQHAFPVDTNVGRLVVRLGWVPLQESPDMVPLHRLDKYPERDDVQKYLWQRLCNLDPVTLRELHCHMIATGKVFCTKKQPNCKACPLRGECKYYGSASKDARLTLPGPKEKNVWSSTITIPKDTLLKVPERDIENLFFEENLWNDMEDNKGDISKTSVCLDSRVSDISMPQLKYAAHLSTKHHVYLLPDSHTLLEKLDRRDPDDSCPYLLATWVIDDSTNSEEQIDEKRSFSFCTSQEQDSETVLGTFFIPCRTAMRGNFPLDGTYFQVNEVFADDESSRSPFTLPKSCIEGLPKQVLYCGTSISNICKVLSSEEIIDCFCNGFTCVRGFNRKTRAPKPLAKRFRPSLAKKFRSNKDKNVIMST